MNTYVMTWFIPFLSKLGELQLTQKHTDIVQLAAEHPIVIYLNVHPKGPFLSEANRSEYFLLCREYCCLWYIIMAVSSLLCRAICNILLHFNVRRLAVNVIIHWCWLFLLLLAGYCQSVQLLAFGCLTAQQCTAAPTSAATMNETAQEITTEMAISVEHEDVPVSESVLPVEQWKNIFVQWLKV